MQPGAVVTLAELLFQFIGLPQPQQHAAEELVRAVAQRVDAVGRRVAQQLALQDPAGGVEDEAREAYQELNNISDKNFSCFASVIVGIALIFSAYKTVTNQTGFMIQMVIAIGFMTTGSRSGDSVSISSSDSFSLSLRPVSPLIGRDCSRTSFMPL